MGSDLLSKSGNFSAGKPEQEIIIRSKCKKDRNPYTGQPCQGFVNQSNNKKPGGNARFIDADHSNL